MKLSKDISGWIKTQVEKAGKSGVVFGLSGGVDSAVVGSLSRLALGDNAMGLILPCKSNERDVELAQDVARKFGIRTKKVVLDSIFDEFVKMYPNANKLAEANLKPRLRMAVLYYFANTMNYLVVGTGNKSEIAIGYFTKHGDAAADILPIGGLLKGEVWELAGKLGVPDEIIKRAPSAGLWEGQTDEGEMGITYDELDKAILAIEKKKTKDIDRETLAKVKKMIKSSEHKRARIPVFRKGGRK